MSRDRAIQLGLGAVLAAFVVGALVLTVVGEPDDEPSAPKAGAFGQHYGGLEQRRLAAGVPTMAEGGGSHFHPEIAIYANGRSVTVPADIGVDPANPPSDMAGLHTHDETGTIHNEAGTGATLGDFFAVWGVPIGPDRLGPFVADDDETVRMWVDGKPSQRFGGLRLEDGQRIVISHGTDRQIPTGVSG